MNSPWDGVEVRANATSAPAIQQKPTPFFSGAWPLAALLLLALLPYLGILRNDFAYIYDDKAQIIDNPYVHSFHHLQEVLTTPVWSFADTRGGTNYYRPVMTLGFLLCYRIFGPLAYGFHLASLSLHAAVVTMLYLFVGRLLRERHAAFIAAALFALHPIHTESVAWISAVTDLEVTFFYVLTFLCFLRLGNESGERGRWFWGQAALIASFILALLSKEQALTLPLLALIYEHFYRDGRTRTTWMKKASRYGPFWLLSAAYIVVRVHLLGTFAHRMGWHHLTWREAFLSAFSLLGQYLFKLLWPVRLSAFYVFHPNTHLLQASVVEGVGALILGVLVFAGLWRGARPASFGILWLLITLAPVLNARWMGSYVLADRYLYLPSVGFCIVAGWAGASLWRKASVRQRLWRLAILVGASAVAALCVLRIVTRVPDWHDEVTLVSRALAAEPDEFILHDGLGDAYWIRGQSGPAEHEWKEALRLNPNFIRPIDSLGALYAEQRRFDESEAYLQRAIKLDPGDADSHLNLGAVYAETDRLSRAEEQFRIAVSTAPLNFAAHNVLGKLYFDSGRLDDAERQFRESLSCESNLAAFDYLGYIDQRRGDTPGAERAFKLALAFNPTDSHAHFNLGLIYAASGRKMEALKELQAALASDSHNSEIQSALEKVQH